MGLPAKAANLEREEIDSQERFGYHLPMKPCKKCLRVLPPENFYQHRRECKQCKSAYSKKYQYDNREKISKKLHEKYLKFAAKIKLERKKYYRENTEKVKSRVKKWRFENAQKVIEYTKIWRSKNKERIYSVQKKHRIKNSGKYVGYFKNWQKKNPPQHAANKKFSAAIQMGKIVRQPCRDCGSKKAQGHHPDYFKPLDVVWLCRPHHLEEHARLRRFKNQLRTPSLS